MALHRDKRRVTTSTITNFGDVRRPNSFLVNSQPKMGEIQLIFTQIERRNAITRQQQ